MIETLAISGYRSLRDVVVPLGQLSVVTGRNGTGKSSFYRALRLLAEIAQGRAIASLAAEGGLGSTLWAGPERFSRAMKAGTQTIEGTARAKSVSLRLGFGGEDYGYAIDLGLPIALAGSMFNRDPEIKAEAVWLGAQYTPRGVIARRAGPGVTATDAKGRRRVMPDPLAPYDSMMVQAADPTGLPEVLVLRERMRAWRFYDHFRTDFDAPARASQIGTRTPALAGDGRDLAAALRTIMEIGDADGLASAIEDAFPGSRLAVEEREGRFALSLTQKGLLRPLGASELSDGTLRYLLLLAALLTPRPPGLIVLNEPETSLHPDLLGALGRLIASSSAHCQIIVVTHAQPLAAALAAAGARSIVLEKALGETLVPDIERPGWAWPKR